MEKIEKKQILEGDMFISGYSNIVDAINSLDIEDKTEEIEKRTKSLEKKEKENGQFVEESEMFNEEVYIDNGKVITDRSKGDELTEKLVNQYKKEQQIIDELKEAQEKVQENQEKAKELEAKRKDVKKNLKAKKDKEILTRENEIKSLEEKIEKVQESKLKIEEEKVGSYRKELAEIEEKEKNDPSMARDEKYKEFLRNKIAAGLKEVENENIFDTQISGYNDKIKEAQEEIKSINIEYREILKKFGKIDRGEKIVEQEEEQTKPEPEPQPEPVPEPEPQPEPEPKPEPVPNPRPKQKNGTEPVPVSNPGPEQEHGPETKPKFEIRIQRKPIIMMGSRIIELGSLNKLMRNKDNGVTIKSLTNIGVETRFAEKVVNAIDPVLISALAKATKERSIEFSKEDLETSLSAILELNEKGDTELTKQWKENKKFNIVYDTYDLSGSYLPWSRYYRGIIGKYFAPKYKEEGIAEVLNDYEYEPNPFKKLFKEAKRIHEEGKRGLLESGKDQATKEKPIDQYKGYATPEPQVHSNEDLGKTLDREQGDEK